MIFIAMLEAGISYAVTGYIFRRLGYPLARLPRFKAMAFAVVHPVGLNRRFAGFCGLSPNGTGLVPGALQQHNVYLPAVDDVGWPGDVLLAG